MLQQRAFRSSRLTESIGEKEGKTLIMVTDVLLKYNFNSF